MKPVRKKIAIQIVPLATVRRKACATRESGRRTATICDIPRFSIRSPALAHTTIAKTMTSVLIRSLLSLAILRRLVVSGSCRCPRHGNDGFVEVAALAHPLQALGAKCQKFRRFVVQAFPLVAIPQGFLHDAPDNLRPVVIIILKSIA